MDSGSDVFSVLWIKFRDLLFFGTPSLCPPGVFDGRGSRGTNAFACHREPRFLLLLTALEHGHCEGDVRPVRIGSGPYGRTAVLLRPTNPMSVANFVTEMDNFTQNTNRQVHGLWQITTTATPNPAKDKKRLKFPQLFHFTCRQVR
jgi:hypothetical protein